VNRKDILENAIQHTCGDRDVEYGSPKENMEHTAELWTTYLGFGVTGADVAMMMALLKISRTKEGKVKADTYEDAAAYIAIAYEVNDGSESITHGPTGK